MRISDGRSDVCSSDLRDSISEAERADVPALQHDVSVPVDLMPRFIAENPGRLAAAFPGVRTLSFGHLGDGNVHHHVQPPKGTDGTAWLGAHDEDVSRLVYSHVLELGGSKIGRASGRGKVWQ